MIDPYASCPCGSGKKFKWCCVGIHEQIEKAMTHQQHGQHEMALQAIDQVVAAHPDNTEAIGRKAQLLHANGRADEAEKTLDEAFAINPQYPFGFLLRGLFRLEEGEQPGAMLLFRKAAEVYAPDASDQLSFLYEQIGNYELRRNNIVAARYAFGHCLRLVPGNQDLIQAFDSVFGEQSRSPMAARQEYRLQGFDAKRPAEWQDAFSKAQAGKLSEAAKAFEALAAQPKADPVASYNAGLLRAWLGENAKALKHLERYVEKEPKEDRAASAWALAEVLLLGEEMADQADYTQHRHLIRFSGDAIVALIQEWDRSGRMVAARSDPESGVLVGLLLEESTGLIGAAAPPAVPIGAQFAVIRDTLSLSHVNPQTLERVVNEVKTSLGTHVVEERSASVPAQFGEVLLETLMLPPYGRATPELLEKSRERAEQFFEEIWANRKLKSLAGHTPIEAAAHPVLRRKLLGAVQFLEQCYQAGLPRPAKGSSEQPPMYDFHRLRNKLGVDTAPPPPAIDFAGMTAADLASLDLEPLTVEQLEKAFRAAVALDNRELAGGFVRAIISRPPDATRPDLFPFFKYFIDIAQTRADWDGALQQVDAGIKADAERNGGLRQNDYELRRGQLFAKKGDADKSQAAFDALIARVPGEPKYRGSAAEAMLALKQGAKARQFAEGGLEEARRQGNRDLEAYFQELIAASKKQGG